MRNDRLRLRHQFGLALMLLALSACIPGKVGPNTEPGALSNACYPNGSCNTGLICQNRICVMFVTAPDAADLDADGLDTGDVAVPGDGDDISSYDASGQDLSGPEIDIPPLDDGSVVDAVDTVDDAEHLADLSEITADAEAPPDLAPDSITPDTAESDLADQSVDQFTEDLVDLAQTQDAEPEVEVETDLYFAKTYSVSGCSSEVTDVLGCSVATSFQVAPTPSHVCAVRNSDKSLWCWGNGRYGNLGLGPSPYYHQFSPQRLDPGKEWLTVSGDGSMKCALAGDQTLWCWDGPYGQGSKDAPSKLYGDTRWAAISVDAGVCAIKTDGTLHCWGYNWSGRLGTGDTLNRETPTLIGSADDRWLNISMGSWHTCGIKADGKLPLGGELYCWGANLNGQLGIDSGDTGDFPSPQRVGAERWIRVSAGSEHSCGIKANGKAYCWGKGYYGRLGTGGEDDTRAPLELSLPTATTFRSVSAGVQSSCAISVAGDLYCWGRNEYGELGIGTLASTPLPTEVSSNWSSVELSGTSCGERNGALYCWGKNEFGQLGNPQATPLAVYPKPVDASTWKVVALGQDRSCAIDGTNRPFCWGSNLGFGLGLGLNEREHRSSPTLIENQTNWLGIAAGQFLGCGLHTSGLICWGSDGVLPYGNTPYTITAGAWTLVAPSDDFICGLKSDGSLFCWGDAYDGKLGMGPGASNQSLPVQLNGDPWLSLCTGDNHACALRKDSEDPFGSLWCWGSNYSGQLGLGDATKREVPTRVGTKNWLAIACGYHHTCGIQSDNSLWCWGANDEGQLGLGNIAPGNTIPASVDNAISWTAISAGTSFTCALDAGSKLWCWGGNERGELGRGDGFYFSSSKGAVAVSLSWKSVQLGNRHACGIDSEDKLWCWGSNLYGQLGVGAFGFETSPSLVVIP